MTSRRVGLMVGAALAAFLASAPVAGAATLGVSGGELQYFSGAAVAHTIDVDDTRSSFVAGDGSYAVTVTGGEATTPLAGCAATGTAGRFLCSTVGVTQIRISAHNQVDTVTTDADDDTCVGIFCLFERRVSVRMVVNTFGGADSITTGAGNDVINSGAEDDTITAGGGADSVTGDAGTDRLQYTDRSSGVSVSLNAGVASGGDAGDTASGIERLTGSNGSDTLLGDAGPNALDGAGGNDTIDGRAGNDAINGDDGDDTLRGGGGGQDTMTGGNGTDTADYSTEDGPVSVDLGAGGFNDGSVNDAGHRDSISTADVERVRGTDAGDTLKGNNAANTLIGGRGSDALDGAGGVDLVTYEGRGDTVNVTLNAVNGDDGSEADGAPGVRDTVVNVEQARGGDANDTLAGDGGANALFGGPGDDTIIGKAGTDVLRGEGDRDTVDYSDRAASQPVDVSLDNAVNDGEQGEADDIGDTFERARGGSGNDRLTALIPGSELYGDNGNDQLFAPNGGGELYGERGNDTLTGGDARDLIFGGDDEDTVEARDGVADAVDCGVGFDTAFTDGGDTRDNCEAGSADADQDGFSNAQDCNDGDPSIRPNAPEIPGNDVDENCDGVKSQEVDRDGDGFTISQDCDDGNAAIRPTATEIPGNRVDENCDAVVGKHVLPPNLKVPASWDRFTGSTRLTKLQVTGVRGGGKVTLTCGKKKGKGRGPGCPFSTKRLKVRKGKANGLSTVRKARFRTGAVLQVRVTTPRFLTLIKRFEFRNGKNPKVSERCQAPGARKTQKCP